MPNGDAEPVAYGRWAAAHAALEARVAALEAATRRGKDHRWSLALAVLTGLALPLAVVTIGVFIHRALSG